MRYEVRHNTIVDGWVNVWSEDGEPLTFPNYGAAHAELLDLLTNSDEAAEDYRIVRLGEEEAE